MKKFILFSCFLYSLLSESHSQVVLKQPLSSRQTGYAIKAQLDPATKIVNGEMVAFWVNKSTDHVNEVQMHLYLNAFRNSNSTYFRESNTMVSTDESKRGWIDIEKISDAAGTDLLSEIQFISPDDGNPEDRTVIRINLPEVCRPGDTVTLSVSFKSKLPSEIRRTGYSGDFFFVAQWFPKFGVYEPAGMRYSVTGGWNCHQFHFNSEFYSNHSVYDVDITVPVEYIVGSGGLLLNESEDGNGNKTLSLRAEDIVDFAWTAWPGYAVYNDEWKHVKITFMSPPERKDQVDRQIQSLKNALEYLEQRVGPYPWPHLTFVDPPAIGSGSGGMEYTTLFTSTSFYGMPEFLKLPEMVTVHEFGHAYFMGILASNEFEEPWLDEGVNTFWEGRIMDHYYGNNSGLINHPLLKLSDRSFARLNYVNSGSRQVSDNSPSSWNYPHGTYGMMSYHKAGVILHTLMGIAGEETVDEIFREYYRRWAFRHPSGKDFIDVANDVIKQKAVPGIGTDLNWFFNQTLYGTGICDYKVKQFFSRSSGISDSLFTTTAELERLGDVILPVEVMIIFDNGDKVTEQWDGKSRTMDFKYTGTRNIVSVRIDPEYKIMMDVNYFNNSLTNEPDNIPVRRLNNKFISFLQFFLSIISI